MSFGEGQKVHKVEKAFSISKKLVPVVAVLVFFFIISIAGARVFSFAERLPVRLETASELDISRDGPDSDPDVQEETPRIVGRALETLKVVSYKVRKGDSLSSISTRYKRRLDTLISFNSVKTSLNVVPGLYLEIPNADGLKYKIRNGDTLSAIAARFKVPLNGILDWNDLKSERIKAGSALFIPGARMSSNDINKVLGTFFIWPVRGILSSKYGYRIHPIDGTRSFHNGLDISGAVGTPIKAAMSGKVLKTGKNFLFGNYIILGHDDGFQTLYGHLSAFGCAAGKYVEQGMEIGKMGNTGYSTGVHLHFSIFKNGDTIDPLKYLKK